MPFTDHLMHKQKLSVALCTYNGIAYLQEQLDSIMQQSFMVDEVIICDDGSTDGTIAFIQKYKEVQPVKIQLFINEENLRVTKNFEKAISLCTGDIIFFADQDDIWEYDKVKKITEYFDVNKQKDVVFTNAFLLDNNIKVNDTAWDKRNFRDTEKQLVKDPVQMLRFLLLKWNVATGATMALRRKAIHRYIPFGSFPHYLHDHQLVLMAAVENKLGFIDECLITYRMHADQQIGFRSRKVPFVVKPVYKLLQYIKKMLIAKKIHLQKKEMADHLKKNITPEFPQARRFLEENFSR